MAETLKQLVGPPQIDRVAQQIRAVWAPFDAARFKAEAKRGLDALELLDRGRHVGRVLRACLPDDTAEAIAIVSRSLGDPLTVTAELGGDVWRYLPYSALLLAHGAEAFDVALTANHALTQRFTAEFSMRGLLAADLDRALRALETWRDDPSPHVRRLVSECTRTRLPWASKVAALSPARRRLVALIEPLRDDESDYVRRSVANHLNDLSKEDPALVLATCKAWLRGVEPRSARWRLCEHALRTLLKRGDAAALALLGVSTKTALLVAGSVKPARLALGDTVAIAATITNPTARATKARVELVVHFARGEGSSRRVFRLGEHALNANGTASVSRRLALVHRTTRKLQSGVHRVELLVNGRVEPIGTFTLRV